MGVRTPNLGQRQQGRRQQQHIRRMERPTGFIRKNSFNSATKSNQMKIINFVLFLVYPLVWQLQVNLFGKGSVVRAMPTRHGC